MWALFKKKSVKGKWTHALLQNVILPCHYGNDQLWVTNSIDNQDFLDWLTCCFPFFIFPSTLYPYFSLSFIFVCAWFVGRGFHIKRNSIPDNQNKTLWNKPAPQHCKVYRTKHPLQILPVEYLHLYGNLVSQENSKRNLQVLSTNLNRIYWIFLHFLTLSC